MKYLSRFMLSLPLKMMDNIYNYVVKFKLTKPNSKKPSKAEAPMPAKSQTTLSKSITLGYPSGHSLCIAVQPFGFLPLQFVKLKIKASRRDPRGLRLQEAKNWCFLLACLFPASCPFSACEKDERSLCALETRQEAAADLPITSLKIIHSRTWSCFAKWRKILPPG